MIIFDVLEKAIGCGPLGNTQVASRGPADLKWILGKPSRITFNAGSSVSNRVVSPGSSGMFAIA